MNVRFLVALGVLVALSACGNGFSADDILDQAPEGRINGSPWLAVEGEARTDPASGRFLVTLFAEDVEECGPSIPTGLGIVNTLVPAEVGEYPLQLRPSDIENNLVVTFVDADIVNYISTEGVVVIETIEEESVTVGILAMVENSDLNGRLTVTRCD